MIAAKTGVEVDGEILGAAAVEAAVAVGARYMGASVRVLEMHYAHLVRDAEETARAKLDAYAATV